MNIQFSGGVITGQVSSADVANKTANYHLQPRLQNETAEKLSDWGRVVETCELDLGTDKIYMIATEHEAGMLKELDKMQEAYQKEFVSHPSEDSQIQLQRQNVLINIEDAKRSIVNLVYHYGQNKVYSLDPSINDTFENGLPDAVKAYQKTL